VRILSSARQYHLALLSLSLSQVLASVLMTSCTICTIPTIVVRHTAVNLAQSPCCALPVDAAAEHGGAPVCAQHTATADSKAKSAAIHVHSGNREEALAVDVGSCALLTVIYGRGGLALVS
jgi:hypothetical protein